MLCDFTLNFLKNLLNSLFVDARSQKDERTFYLFSKEHLKTNCSLLCEHCTILLLLKVLILWSDHTISFHSCASDRQIRSNLYMNLVQFVWVRGLG